jgi:hypothetical protein
MLIAARLQRENTGTRSARAQSTRRAARFPPHLPFELWNMMLGFVKHDALPVLADDGWEPAEEESESEEEDAEGDVDDAED